ncbi:MAG: excinuclease ABC subunit UvrB, partial [Flavobacteriales bacterium]|nr:excinuclease ABC subunit UvrB [Flavobacteriales bacterium]
EFQLIADFKPMGDQPTAIKQLVEGVEAGDAHQVLLGVTGSGKTFTMANVIAQTGRPTLILSHNKTLAAQLFGEFKQFFPNNAVEYYVSYYDYYQPEAYLPVTDTYIEKDLQINDEIEKHRLSAASTLLSGRRDVVVISSVSCIYGIGNPTDFQNNTIEIKVGQQISREKFLHSLVSSLYARSNETLERGQFRVKGDTIDVYLAYADYAYRVFFFGNEIEEIEKIDPKSGSTMETLQRAVIYPANNFVTSKDTLLQKIWEIQEDMVKQVDYFKETGKPLEAKRLQERVEYDIEMMRELGYCSGIENYSRYFDGRKAGTRPFCLMDYFPDDFLMFIDESHVTVSQIGAMYGGDRSRKENLVGYGFRLPSAMDNRPLKFDEFESITNQMIYVSATPADYELEKSGGIVAEQIIRPTGLLDPIIEVRPSVNQVDDLLDMVDKTVKKKERVLVTTLTKRMSEELAKYMARLGVNCRYIHSEVDTVERVEILRDLRLGNFDVLIGINLLREGLDLPEVSLVAILDADKEGFLRSSRSLTQTAGRAARNVNGLVIMYADKITKSMRQTIDETERRREKQIKFNTDNGMVPTALKKSREAIMGQTSVAGDMKRRAKYDIQVDINQAAEEGVAYLSKDELKKRLGQTRVFMEQAAKELDFLEAARLRDEMKVIELQINKSL